jgi:hypothetical protein
MNKFRQRAKASRFRDLVRKLDEAPSQTIESGRVGVRPQAVHGRRVPFTQAPKIRPAAIAPSQPVRPVRLPRATPLGPQPLPTAERIVSRPVKALAPPTLPTAKPLEPGTNEPIYVLGKKQTNEVQKALSPEAYRAKYGYARDLTAPVETRRGEVIGEGARVGITGTTTAGLKILLGPAPLNHSGRLRRSGKPSRHWAAFAYLLQFGDGPEMLGVKFFSGFRCYYPSTSRGDYQAIIAAGSGSYWAIDNLIGRSYVPF